MDCLLVSGVYCDTQVSSEVAMDSKKSSPPHDLREEDGSISPTSPPGQLSLVDDSDCELARHGGFQYTDDWAGDYWSVETKKVDRPRVVNQPLSGVNRRQEDQADETTEGEEEEDEEVTTQRKALTSKLGGRAHTEPVHDNTTAKDLEHSSPDNKKNAKDHLSLNGTTVSTIVSKTFAVGNQNNAKVNSTNLSLAVTANISELSTVEPTSIAPRLDRFKGGGKQDKQLTITQTPAGISKEKSGETVAAQMEESVTASKKGGQRKTRRRRAKKSRLRKRRKGRYRRHKRRRCNCSCSGCRNSYRSHSRSKLKRIKKENSCGM
ncbi:hypothetical protein AAG570_003938 [Ranatra chinensis]|uniref:Uncharacterized protein n=1 Tax=Ranatra chinensis TaxID=642074 RepID=A0ABD0Y2N7_9HEMI